MRCPVVRLEIGYQGLRYAPPHTHTPHTHSHAHISSKSDCIRLAGFDEELTSDQSDACGFS